MQGKIGIILLLGILIATGCGKISAMKQKSAFIIIKTPTMRYADMGFIYQDADEVNVEIYNSGQPLLRLNIGKSAICSGRFRCLTRDRFNRRMLTAAYSEDMLEQIFRGKPIEKGKGIVIRRNGFTQHIFKEGKYDISYHVLKNETVFHDTINHIIIKIRTLRG